MTLGMPSPSSRGLLARATSPRALRTTVPAALVVGSALTVVNNWSRFANGVNGELVLRVTATYLVPWANATYGFLRGERDADLP